MLTRQIKNGESVRLNFYVVLQPATKSSRSQMLFKIGVIKNFAKSTGKHLCKAHVFSCEFYEIFKNTFCLRTPPVAAFVQLYRI